jgi:hypothetical protein
MVTEEEKIQIVSRFLSTKSGRGSMVGPYLRRLETLTDYAEANRPNAGITGHAGLAECVLELTELIRIGIPEDELLRLREPMERAMKLVDDPLAVEARKLRGAYPNAVLDLMRAYRAPPEC